MIDPITTLDGKYTFSVPEGDWRVHVLRHGDPWLVIEEGHNAICALLWEIRDSREDAERHRDRIPGAV